MASSQQSVEASGPSFPVSLERIALLLLSVLCLLKLGFLCAYAYRMRWVMDEFAQGYVGRYVADGLYERIDPVKTALPNLLFYLTERLGGDAIQVLTLQRSVALAAALISVFAIGALARRLHGRWMFVLLAVLTLLSFSNYIERSFRVRNDSFAAFLSALALACLGWRERPLRASFASGALAGGAFLCTQKAFYQLAALGLANVILGAGEGKQRLAVQRSTAYLGGACAALVLYGLGFGGLEAPRVLAAVFLSPLQNAQGLLSAQHFSEMGRFVPQTLTRNAFPYALCAAGLFAAAFSRRQRGSLGWAAGAATVLTAAIFLHPQPWPYVFVPCLLFLAPLAPAGITVLRRQWQPVAVLTATCILGLSLQRNVAAMSHDNQQQFAVVRQAESMLAPGQHFFDGIGMVPTRPIAGPYPHWWWDAPTLRRIGSELQGGASPILNGILRDQPKVWIGSYRLRALGPWFVSSLELSTVAVTPWIRVSGAPLQGETQVPFRALWTGKYRRLDQDGRPVPGRLLLDGQPCDEPCHIRRGSHRVSTTDERATVLLPANVRTLGPLPAPRVGYELFADVYDF